VLDYIRGDGQKFLNKAVIKDNTVR
jgi:hypothetical protein